MDQQTGRQSSGNYWSWTEKRIFKNEGIWSDIKYTNICIIGVPEGEEDIFEDLIDENFSNLGKKTDIEVQESKRVPNKINPKGTTPKTLCNHNGK